MNLFSVRGALLGLSFSLVAAEALAVPAFARRYEVACTFCHNVFPKLNRMGERFKERGYRLENEDQFDRRAWIGSAPISGRLFGTRYLPEGRDGQNVGFLRVLSAGSLGKRASYWVDDAWVRSGGATTHVKPDHAWFRWDFKPAGKLYARLGRFELDLPVTQARTPHLLPYDIYYTSTGLEFDNIGQYQEGLEVGGEIGRTHLSAAVVRGRNNDAVVELAEQSGAGDPGRFDGNLFLRATRRMARSRVGAFAYVGRNDLVARLNATRVGVARNDILRLGLDGNTWIWKVNLYGLAMYGRNSNSLMSLASPTGTRQALEFSGGFLAADYHVWEQIAVTVRVQSRRVELPGTSPADTLTTFMPGVQIVLWKLKFSAQASLSTNNVRRLSVAQIETAF